jgi:hypothetical protein
MDDQNPSGEQIALPLGQAGVNGAARPDAPRVSGLLVEFCARFSELASSFQKSSLNPTTPVAGSDVFARIPALVKTASPFKRPRFRRAALEMLGQLYSEKYEELKQQGLEGKVEECYRELKG